MIPDSRESGIIHVFHYGSYRTRICDLYDRVDGQRVTLASTFPTVPLRTGRTPFSVSGSPKVSSLSHDPLVTHSSLSPLRFPVRLCPLIEGRCGRILSSVLTSFTLDYHTRR